MSSETDGRGYVADVGDDGFRPGRGYALVKVTYERPPDEAQTLVRRYDRIEDVDVPDGTAKLGYVVYDAHGNTYTREELEREREKESAR